MEVIKGDFGKQKTQEDKGPSVQDVINRFEKEEGLAKYDECILICKAFDSERLMFSTNMEESAFIFLLEQVKLAVLTGEVDEYE